MITYNHTGLLQTKLKYILDEISASLDLLSNPHNSLAFLLTTNNVILKIKSNLINLGSATFVELHTIGLALCGIARYHSYTFWRG